MDNLICFQAYKKFIAGIDITKTMNPILFRSKPVASLCLAAIAFLLVSAVAFANPGTTTLGTRGELSRPNLPITSNARAKWTTYSRNPDYQGSVTLPLQFIDTSEGGKLAVLVSVPANRGGQPVQGKFPAILTQTAYRTDLGDVIGTILPSQTTLIIGGRDKYMNRRGYVTVAVDVRGTGISSGVTALIGEEEQAAYADAVDWITKQAWFDGNLGLAGTSYLGITALLTAAQGHPAVKAVFAEVPMGDAYRGTVVPGGMLNATFINIWLTLTQNLSVANDNAVKKYPRYADQIAAATQDHIAATDAWYMPTINGGLNAESGYATDDGNFWAVRSPVEVVKNIKVPTFFIGSTNDIFQRCEPLLYEQLKNKVNTKLLVVPGAHIQAIISAMGDQNKPASNGAPGSETLLLQWFDHYLRGEDTGVESLPNVTQYVEGYERRGTQRYATATDWPHPKAAPQRFYLHGDMSLNTAAPSSNETSRTISEPEAPSVSIDVTDGGAKVTGSVSVSDGSDCSSSGMQWSLGMAGCGDSAETGGCGASDQTGGCGDSEGAGGCGASDKPCYTDSSIVEAAQDALIYETAPLTSNLYINGPMQADIWISATNSQAAVAVRIDDVDASGKATPISTGIQSAVHRAVDTSRSRYVDGVMVQPWHPFTEASMQPLTPNEPVLVPVEIFPAAALIRAGHRLRIAISASNQAMGIWPLPQQAEAEGNVTTIYNDPEHPSSLVVLKVPASELN